MQQAWTLVQEKMANRNEEDETPEEVFWRTTITNRRADSSQADTNIEGREFELWWDTITHSTEDSNTIFGTLVNNYERAWYQHGFQRLLFTTDTGFVGLARPGIRRGDRVCLLAGAQTPFTVRGNDEKYQTVCETYVHGHGIMDGEFWQDLEDVGAERAEFVLI